MLVDKWNLLGLAMFNQKLQPSTRCVMYALLNRENSKTKALFPSHKRLALDINMSVRSVRRGVNELIEHKFIYKIKKGSPGIATDYKINYEKLTKLSVTQANSVQKRGSKVADQSINKSINKSRVKKFVNNIAINTNANVKLYKNGQKKSYNDPENVAHRIYVKTNSISKSEAYLLLKKSTNWDDKVRADEFAKHLGCLE
jgi:DNA-binding transcriptional regulator YhcF (GntR family)